MTPIQQHAGSSPRRRRRPASSRRLPILFLAADPSSGGVESESESHMSKLSEVRPFLCGEESSLDVERRRVRVIRHPTYPIIVSVVRLIPLLVWLTIHPNKSRRPKVQVLQQPRVLARQTLAFEREVRSDTARVTTTRGHEGGEFCLRVAFVWRARPSHAGEQTHLQWVLALRGGVVGMTVDSR